MLEAADIDVYGVLKNGSASAPAPAGPMLAENYEIVIAPTGDLQITGDVDALGSILIVAPNAFTLAGSLEAGGLETFHFITEARTFVDGGDERVRIVGTADHRRRRHRDRRGRRHGRGYQRGSGRGDTYPLGAQIAASGLIELVTPGAIVVQNASEAHRAPRGQPDLPGSRIGGNFRQPLRRRPTRPGAAGRRSGIDWETAPAADAAIEIQATEMVRFGGDDVNGATDLDVLLGLADAAGTTLVRGGSAQATGPVTILVSGGMAPHFELNALSFIKTDAAPIDLPTDGALGHITITTDRGIDIQGVIQAIDPDADVTLDSGDGLLDVSGYVEAGRALSLTGADALSGEAVSVVVDKLFYETLTQVFPTLHGATAGSGEFIVDLLGQPIDAYGFLLERDGLGNVLVDIDGNPSQVIGANGYPVLGEGAVYITYDESDAPVLVDKEGYALVADSGRYFRVDESDQLLDENGMVVNADGLLLGVGGILVNEFGYRIDAYGNFVNAGGDPIDAYGRQIDTLRQPDRRRQRDPHRRRRVSHQRGRAADQWQRRVAQRRGGHARHRRHRRYPVSDRPLREPGQRCRRTDRGRGQRVRPDQFPRRVRGRLGRAAHQPGRPGRGPGASGGGHRSG